MRFSPEEKLELITMARYSGLGFERTLELFGLKPSRVYLWIRNIEKEGLKGLIDKPPLPQLFPHRCLKEEEALIINKAKEYSHLTHRKLAHQIFRDTELFVSESLVYRILKKYNLIRAKPCFEIEAAQNWKIQPQEPNQIWHIDICYIRCEVNQKAQRAHWYLIAVLDGYSRFTIAWELFPDMSKERVFEVVDQAIFLTQLPLDRRPKLVSDNGKQFRAKRARQFFKELIGIKQIFSSPHHPETNGKIERLFESAKYEALYRNDYTSPQQARDILLKFFDYYNNYRLHQALGYRTPQEVYYGLNKDYSQRRKIARLRSLFRRKQYWTTLNSGGLLTTQKS